MEKPVSNRGDQELIDIAIAFSKFENRKLDGIRPAVINAVFFHEVVFSLVSDLEDGCKAGYTYSVILGESNVSTSLTISDYHPHDGYSEIYDVKLTVTNYVVDNGELKISMNKGVLTEDGDFYIDYVTFQDFQIPQSFKLFSQDIVKINSEKVKKLKLGALL